MRLCMCPAKTTMAAGASSALALVAAVAGSPPCLCCCPLTRQDVIFLHRDSMRTTVVTFCIRITFWELPVNCNDDTDCRQFMASTCGNVALADATCAHCVISDARSPRLGR